MIDLATRPQRNNTSAAAAFGVPFDWRLAKPGPVIDYPYTDYTTPSGLPSDGVEPLATYSMQLEDTLATAITISLFSDRRATADDVLPPHETDRRGWVGEAFVGNGAGADTDPWGSRLWLIQAGKVQAEPLELARYAAKEALQWLVRDGIASKVDATASWVGPRADRLALRAQVWKPDQAQPVYDVLWRTTITRGPL